MTSQSGTSAVKTRGYVLKRPCPECPFRTDIDGYLRPERAREIGESLLNGAEFPCHKTTEYDEDTADMVSTSGSVFCAGALIMLEKSGIANQAMRFAERFGMYDAAALDMDAPVCGSVIEFQAHHGAEEPESEPCHVAEMGCLAPAGYAVGDGVVAEFDREETSTCEWCGEATCDACGEVIDGEFVCLSCQENAA